MSYLKISLFAALAFGIVGCSGNGAGGATTVQGLSIQGNGTLPTTAPVYPTAAPPPAPIADHANQNQL